MSERLVAVVAVVAVVCAVMFAAGFVAAKFEVRWAGHPMTCNGDAYMPRQGWTPDVEIGWRDDGVVVWRKTPVMVKDGQ